MLKVGLALFLIGIISAGCEKDHEENYESISLKYTQCPCDNETNFLVDLQFDKVILFNASITSFTEMKSLSFEDNEALFISYKPGKDSTFFYSYKVISNTTYVNVGHICNFPAVAQDWEISPTGIQVSFSINRYESCQSVPSVGSTSYTDDVLTSLSKYQL